MNDADVADAVPTDVTEISPAVPALPSAARLEVDKVDGEPIVPPSKLNVTT